MNVGTAPARAAAPLRWTPSRHRSVAPARSSWPPPWPKRPGTASRCADAAVLYATRVLGMSLTEVAQLAGLPAGHLRRRRRIAIDRLVA